jgi:hypothetical protein
MLRSLAIATLLGTCALAAPSHAERFDFVTLGDTAYRLPADQPVYDALIDRINAAKPAFTIHVGDIWGATPCIEAEYGRIRASFDRFRQPLVYTPGDNEWVDCRDPAVIAAYVRYVRGEATPEDLARLAPLQSLPAALARTGYDDVLARLADIRRIFFARAESLGRKPMPLVRQADGATFQDVPENARWRHADVVFATVHVTGSANDFYLNDERLAKEAIRRSAAAIAWLQSTFEEAKSADAKAVVIAMHAQLFLDGDANEEFGLPVRGGDDGPYYLIARAIRDLGAEFGKPVLLVHGDFHEFVVDKPFRVTTSETTPPKFDNITRLQVYGAPDVRAVRVSVDTATPWVFGFTPLY